MELDPGRFEACYEKERGQGQPICALTTVAVTIKNGYNFIMEGYAEAAAAIAAGKVFAVAANIEAFPGQGAVDGPSEAVIHAFEQAGHFKYQDHPVQQPKKAGYMVDFSTCFKKGQ